MLGARAAGAALRTDQRGVEGKTTCRQASLKGGTALREGKPETACPGVCRAKTVENAHGTYDVENDE